MPYILNKTNGSTIAIVQDASLDVTTDLTFLGRNYAGYGEYQNENFLRLLENFNNTTAPGKPVEGQLWFNSSNKKINVYDGINWKGIANLDISQTNPSESKTFLAGDLWYDSLAAQLYVYNGTSFILIGPPTGDDTKSAWKGSREYSAAEGTQSPKFNLKAVVGTKNDVIALISADSYTVIEGSQSFPVYPGQTVIKKGITLIGSNAITGVSENNGIYFWGSAAHALSANTSTDTQKLLYVKNTSTNKDYSLPFINTSTSELSSIPYYDTGLTYNPSSKILRAQFFDGTATKAYYADLAERYEADKLYDPGTVLVLGGEKEVTVTDKFADTRVAGIVSENPAYMMNSGAGSDETHPYIALKGRVPCKVVGAINKGDLLVTSTHPGYAMAAINPNCGALIGKALGSQSEGFGIVEVLVV